MCTCMSSLCLFTFSYLYPLQFITIGSTVLFDRYVRAPANPQEAAMHMGEFEMAGFPGCVGSADATHITIEKCSHRLRQNHKGGKTKLTTRTYNISVNHRRRIIGTTRGHPGSWNDQTLVLFDSFIRGLKPGKNLQGVAFELLERNDKGEVVAVQYKGAYVIVDNGYLAWSCTVPPIKATGMRPEIRWSEWLESMRKDVECTFGILKGRWRVLKTGIRLHGTEPADKIWATCCALHNWLLEVDGLDEPWDGQLGNIDTDDLSSVPFALRRLASPSAVRNFDLSGMGPGRDRESSDGNGGDGEGVGASYGGGGGVGDGDGNGTRLVRKMSLATFRSKLVEHFHIKWQCHEIKWPERRGTRQPYDPP